MSRKIIITLVVSAAVGMTLMVVYAKTSATRSRPLASASQTLQGSGANIEDGPAQMDLASQPEALKLSRRIGGNRFKARSASALDVSGVITTGTSQQSIQITRRRTATGESVKLFTPDSSIALEWEASAGISDSSKTPNAEKSAEFERLIFDSVDQFILAQLRGASYYVVARNVRPDNAPDNYSGPLWDVVRIEDAAVDEQKGSQSKWRLYYLNRTTGLIDKVVSESQGQRIEASFSDWKKQGDELSPSTITWTSNGQTLMTFTVNTVSLSAQAAQ